MCSGNPRLLPSTDWADCRPRAVPVQRASPRLYTFNHVNAATCQRLDAVDQSYAVSVPYTWNAAVRCGKLPCTYLPWSALARLFCECLNRDSSSLAKLYIKCSSPCCDDRCDVAWRCAELNAKACVGSQAFIRRTSVRLRTGTDGLTAGCNQSRSPHWTQIGRSIVAVMGNLQKHQSAA